MKKIAKSLILVIVSALVLTSCSNTQDPNQKEWIEMFNGKNLGNWTPKITGYDLGENPGNIFRVEDGILKVSYDAFESFDKRFGHLFYNTPMDYYQMELEYRFTGEQTKGGPGWAYRNSGIMIHGQPAMSMKKNQDFPTSIEVQLLGGFDTGERRTGNLCTPGTHVEMDGKLIKQHCTESTSKTYPPEEWVKAEILVMGNEKISHIINGDTVIQYAKPQLDSTDDSFKELVQINEGIMLFGGSISLQAESHPCEFRNVRILPLKGCMDPKAKNYKSYYKVADNSQCIYD